MKFRLRAVLSFLCFLGAIFGAPPIFAATTPIIWSQTPISVPSTTGRDKAIDFITVPIAGADNDRLYYFMPTASNTTEIYYATINETTGEPGSFSLASDDDPAWVLPQKSYQAAATHSALNSGSSIQVVFGGSSNVYTLFLNASGDITSMTTSSAVLAAAPENSPFLTTTTIGANTYLYVSYQALNAGNYDFAIQRCDFNTSTAAITNCSVIRTDTDYPTLTSTSSIYYENAGEKYIVIVGGHLYDGISGNTDTEDDIRAFRIASDSLIDPGYLVGQLPVATQLGSLIARGKDIYYVGGFYSLDNGVDPPTSTNNTTSYAIENLLYDAGSDSVSVTSINTTNQEVLPFDPFEMGRNSGTLAGAAGKTFVYTYSFSSNLATAKLNLGTLDAADLTGPVFNFTQSHTGLVGKEFTFIGTITDAQSNITTAEWWLDGSRADIINLTTGDPDALTESFSQQIIANGNLGGVTEGTHTIEFVAIDSLGNETRQSFSIDIDASSPVCTDGWSNLPTPHFSPLFTYTNITCTDNRSIAEAGYAFYHASYGYLKGGLNDIGSNNIFPVDGTFDETSESFTFTINLSANGNIDGRVFPRLHVFDAAGNISFDEDPLTSDVHDDTAPVINLDQITPDPTTDVTPAITGSCVDNNQLDTDSYISLLEYKVDAGSYSNVVLADSGVYSDSYQENFSVELATLNVGSHTVTIRCSDDSGQVSTTSDTFEVIAQTETQAGVYTFTESFDSQTNQDIPNSSNTVWGNGKLRLKEDITLTRTSLNTTGNCGRYDTCYGKMVVRQDPQDNNLLWYQIGRKIYSFNIATQTSTWLDYATLYGINNLTTNVNDFRLGVYQGKKYLIFSSSYDLIAVNLTDGVAFSSPNYLGATNFSLDFSRGRMGLYLNVDTVGPTSKLAYLDLNGTFSNVSDDVLTRLPLSELNYVDLGNSLLDPNTNALYVAAFNSGFYKINDQNTPADFSDDISTLYANSDYLEIFDAMTLDPAGRFIFATANNSNGKIFVVSADGGTPFDSSDDTVTQLNQPIQTSYRSFFGVQYIAGENGVGDQLFLSSEDADPIYLNFNNTYTNLNDDTYISLPANGGIRPGAANILVTDYNTIYSVNTKQGFYKLDLQRGWADSGQAIGLPTKPPQRLVVDNFTAAANTSTPIAYRTEHDASQSVIGDLLHAITPQAMASEVDGIHYFVSTNNGTTWNEVTLNELKQLQQDDYRIKFKITMDEVSGSTPVLDSYQLDYGGYVSGSQQDTVIGLSVANSISTVQTNTSFSSTVEAVDSIGFKVSSHSGTATLQLIDSVTNSVTSGLNQSSAAIVNGTVTISGLQINKTGTFKIRAIEGAYSVDSAVITATNTPTLISPQLSFGADNYTIKAGEKTSIHWTSQNLKAFTLNPGAVPFTSTSGTFQVSPTQTTTYSLRGTGDHGEVTNTLTIVVSGSIEVASTATTSASLTTSLTSTSANPKVEVGQVKNDPAILKVSGDETVIKGQKVTVSWEAVGVDRVSIDYLGKDVSTLGSFDFYPAQNTTITITAYKGDQIYQERVTITVIEAPLSVQQAARTLQEIFPSSTGLVAGIVQIAQKVPSIALGFLIASQATLTGLLLWTIVAQSSLAALNLATLVDLLRTAGILPYKKRKGFIHQTKTGKPVPFALISVFEQLGNKKTLFMTLVSDVYGVYVEPYLPKGTFIFEASQTEHSFPTTLRRPTHLQAMDFYKGEEIAVKSNKTQQSLLIPMDTLNTARSWKLLKHQAMLAISRILITLRWTIYPLSVLSFIAAVLSPSAFNIVIAAIYAVLLARQVLRQLKKPSLSGRVTDKGTLSPIANATVLLNQEDGLSVAVSKTNAAGYFDFYVKEGSYALQVASTNYVFTETAAGNLYMVKSAANAKPLRLQLTRQVENNNFFGAG